MNLINWTTCSTPDGAPTLNCLPEVFQAVIQAALSFSGVVALFFIIWGGIRYITSQGDQKQIDNARKTLTFAIIGLVVIMLSFFILHVISSITGVGCITLLGFDVCK